MAVVQEEPRSVMKLVFSKFAHTSFRDEVIAIFNSLQPIPIFVRKEVYESLLACMDKEGDDLLCGSKEEIRNLIQILEEKNILIRDPKKDDYLLNSYKESIPKPSVNFMYLMLTSACNFNCQYCFVLNKNKRTKNLSNKKIKESLLLFSKLISQNKDTPLDHAIILYGGEPLVNYQALTYVVNLVKSYKKEKLLPLNTKIILITNGALLNKENIEFLRQNDVHVSISIDGDEFSNQYRLDNNLQSTQHLTLKAIDLCLDEKIELSLSCTLTDQNTLNFERTVDNLIAFNVKDISFNFLKTNEGIKLDENYNGSVNKFITYAFERLSKHGIYEDKVSNKAEPFLNQEPYFYECGATRGSQVVIAPDGTVGICQATVLKDKHILGNLDTFNADLQSNPVYSEWRKRTPFNMSQCCDCSALGICGGGCPINAEGVKKSIWELDLQFCSYSKFMVEWLIWKLYDEIDKNR